MPTSFIYAIVVLIWGTTRFIITCQLGVVAPEISLVYRFGLAAICVFAYARVTGNSLRLSWREHRFVALQGATLFCLNGWMIFGTPIERRVLVAAGAGMLGVALLFLPELQAAFHNPTIAHGAALAL